MLPYEFYVEQLVKSDRGAHVIFYFKSKEHHTVAQPDFLYGVVDTAHNLNLVLFEVVVDLQTIGHNWARLGTLDYILVEQR